MSHIRTKTIGEACFWLGLVIEILIVIVDKSAYTNPLESQLFRLTFLLFCIKIALTKYSAGEWLCMLLAALLMTSLSSTALAAGEGQSSLCMLLFGAVMFVSYRINERDEAVRIIAFIAACKGMDIKKVMRVVCWVTFAGCAALVLLSVTGIYGKVAVTANFGREVQPGQFEETRYVLGMGHPNALHCMFWMVVVLAVYSYADVLRWYHYALFMALNFALYSLTGSKTGVIVCFLFLASSFVMRYCRKCRECRGIYILGAVAVLGCVVFAAVFSHLENTYDTVDTLVHKLDSMLNGRYQSCYAVEAARLENWKLFAAPENIAYFDAGFVRLFYWYGIIPGLIYVGMNFYLLYQSYKEKDHVLFTMLVTFAVFNLMEAHFISVYILRN